MKPWRWTVGIAVIAFLAGVAGVFVGRALIPARPHPYELHEVLHQQLKLETDQDARLEPLEQQFAVRRRALELDLRAANARLADAIQGEHDNGPRVAASVDASHAAMGELQKMTLTHIFTMREILRPDQADKFDRAVVKALTAEVR